MLFAQSESGQGSDEAVSSRVDGASVSNPIDALAIAQSRRPSYSGTRGPERIRLIEELLNPHDPR
jgi:hypothetical protein